MQDDPSEEVAATANVAQPPSLPQPLAPQVLQAPVVHPPAIPPVGNLIDMDQS